MALRKIDLQKLIEMQTLCDRVIDKTEALTLALETVRALNEDLSQLEGLYDNDWLRIYSDKRLTDSDGEALLSYVKDGRYSILSQDTIWDALQDAQQIQLSLAKLLVKHL